MHFLKTGSKFSKDLNIRYKTAKLLEENSHDIGLSNGFFYDPKSISNQSKNRNRIVSNNKLLWRKINNQQNKEAPYRKGENIYKPDS